METINKSLYALDDVVSKSIYILYIYISIFISLFVYSPLLCIAFDLKWRNYLNDKNIYKSKR